MELFRLTGADADALQPLHIAYKKSIGEDAPTQEDFASLKHAIEDERILFFGCRENGQLIGCCSVSITFSTFCYGPSGVFEDFFILPAYQSTTAIIIILSTIQQKKRYSIPEKSGSPAIS